MNDTERHAVVSASLNLRDRAAKDCELAAVVQLGVLDLNDEVLRLREQLRQSERDNATLRGMLADELARQTQEMGT